MHPELGQPSHPSESVRSVFSLPCGDEAVCLFEVSQELARCIGIYARIPEFARDGHLLQISRLVSGQTG